MIAHKIYAIIGSDNIVNNIKIFDDIEEANIDAANTQIGGYAIDVSLLPVKSGDFYNGYVFVRNGEEIFSNVDEQKRIQELENIIVNLKNQISFLENKINSN